MRQEKNNGGLCTRHGGGGVGHNMAEKLVVFLFLSPYPKDEECISRGLKMRMMITLLPRFSG